MKVQNMTSSRGNKVPNQFIITDNEGNVYFQSYKTIIAKKEWNGSGFRVLLDENLWDYSTTTGKYRNRFLGCNKKECQMNIDDNVWGLVDLN